MLEVDANYAQVIPNCLRVKDWPSFYASWQCQLVFQSFQQGTSGLQTGRERYLPQWTSFFQLHWLTLHWPEYSHLLLGCSCYTPSSLAGVVATDLTCVLLHIV